MSVLFFPLLLFFSVLKAAERAEKGLVTLGLLGEAFFKSGSTATNCVLNYFKSFSHELVNSGGGHTYANALMLTIAQLAS